MKYDTIVIGAGSAGAIVATRLSETTDRSVLLLEAGPDYPSFDHLPPEKKNFFRDVWTWNQGGSDNGRNLHYDD